MAYRMAQESIASELLRLQSGSMSKRSTTGTWLVRFIVTGSADVRIIIERAIDVLRTVDEHAHQLPDLEAWPQILPQWFVSSCAPEQSQEELERWIGYLNTLGHEERAAAEARQRWTLVDWLYWFEPERREWFWWDWKQITESAASVDLTVAAWPFPWGAFAWLMRASGASGVTAQEDSEPRK